MSSSGEWKEFFDFLSENIQHIRVVHKINIDRINRTKKRLLRKKTPEQVKKWYDERVEIFQKHLTVLESCPHLIKIEENTHSHTFQLTPEYQSTLQNLIKPCNFWVENPFFEMFELTPEQFKYLTSFKPLFDGIYNPLSDVDAAKEVHIDIKYDELTKNEEKNTWLLTETASIPNSGTEFLKIPCLKPEFILPLGFDFYIDVKIHNHSENRLESTFCSQILSCLTSFYAENHVSPKQWQRTQSGILHNAASCYYHRSPQLIDIDESFERKHWVFENEEKLNILVKELRISK